MLIEERFLDQYVLMCKAVSKPDRLKIIHILGDKKINVGTIQKKLDISLSSLSNLCSLTEPSMSKFILKAKNTI